MDYDRQLEQNRLAAGLTPQPWQAEWQVLLSSKYAYDPTYDYVGEGGTLARLTNEYKRQGIHDDPVVAARNVLISQPTQESNVNKHKLAWVYWIDYKKKDFIKDWKPRDDQGLNYMWLTFNFKDDTPILIVLQDMARIINLPIFSRCTLTYCYEYYGEAGTHPHVHMLVELKRTGTIPFSSIEDKVFQMKKLREYLNIKYKFSWAKDFEKRCQKRAVIHAYLDGDKIDKKVTNSLKDKLWRQENNLEDKYIKDNN